jgi:nucleoside-diphosphate-sugar epimerase
MRSYGYVGNVVHQIFRILTLPRELVDQKVYYVGDRPIDLYDWVNGFSMHQRGRRVKIVPSAFVYFLALTGDLAALIGIRFPITRSRYRSMTTSNPADMEKTFRELGENAFNLDEGIRETVAWLRKEHPDLVTIQS